MVKNNIKNIVASALNIFLLRFECLKLEVRIIWEGNTFLKMYKTIDTLNEQNGQKLACCNKLQFEVENINNEINNDLNIIKLTKTKVTNRIFCKIQTFNDVKRITEDKFSHKCLLNKKRLVMEDRLKHRLSFFERYLITY